LAVPVGGLPGVALAPAVGGGVLGGAASALVARGRARRAGGARAAAGAVPGRAAGAGVSRAAPLPVPRAAPGRAVAGADPARLHRLGRLPLPALRQPLAVPRRARRLASGAGLPLGDAAEVRARPAGARPAAPAAGPGVRAGAA